MARKKTPKERPVALEENPDQRSLTARQLEYLAVESGVDRAELEALKVGDLPERLRFKIDPTLLFYRKICGRIVKRDPETGALWPVPNATVYVEDTDCSFLGFSPDGSPWSWIFPFACRREVIAVVQADECGEFCVFVPRWDIDRIVRWRRERICLPELVPPRIRDLLEDLPIPRPRPPFPFPEPDPVPPVRPPLEDPQLRPLIEARLGRETASRLAALMPDRRFGAATRGWETMLDEPAPISLLPPLPEDPQGAASGTASAEILDRIDFSHPVGPFRICRDVFVPEWTTVLDVPDITFRATQTAPDGTEVTIYDEGFFDVRWNDGDPGPVVLEATGAAIAVPICGAPAVDCEDQPAIDTVGFMSLLGAYHDNSTGRATRVNRPRPAPVGGATNCGVAQVGTAHAPYSGRLDLFGCHHIGDATHYRILYRYEGGPEQPFLGVAWWAPRQTPLAPLHIAPDAAGWYVIQPAGVQLRHPHWLFAWPSWKDANGRYELVLQVGKASGSGITETSRSNGVVFTIDNSAPDLQLSSLQWRFASEPPGAMRALPLICPVISRAGGGDIIVRVGWSATSAHLRDARASMAGCGGPDPVAAPGSTSGDFCHWHVGPTDNTVSRVSEFLIPATAAAGCYTAHASAYSRAFNPSDGSAGPLFDWWVNQTQRWSHTSRAISVVD